MSSEETQQAPETTQEEVVEFAPENTTPAPTENPQPIKTDVEELVEFFSTYQNKDEALQAMKNGLTGEGKDKRFSANGKTYSQANCRKAINRADDKGLFKGQVTTAEVKDLTYKMEVPPTLPRPQQALTPPPEEIKEQNQDGNGEEPVSFTGDPYHPEDTGDDVFQQPPPQQEPIDPKAAKKNGQLIQGVLNLLADYFEEPKAKINDKDAIEYGEDLVILCPDLANSKNAAAAHLIGGLVLTRGAMLAPKAYTKITGALKGIKEGKN